MELVGRIIGAESDGSDCVKSRLIEGVQRCDMGAMKEAIAAGADLNEIDGGMTPVLWAIFRRVVNDIVNFAAANDAPGVEGKSPFNELLHSFEVHYPIRFPCFSTIG